MDALKFAWKNINSEPPVNPSTQEKIVTFINRFMQANIYDETDENLKILILKEWGRQ
jgi:hemerythrin-like domain-containing protein